MENPWAVPNNATLLKEILTLKQMAQDQKTA